MMKKIAFWVLGGSVTLALWLIWSVWWTLVAGGHALTNAPQSQRALYRAQPLVILLNLLTQQKSASLEIWAHSLQLIETLPTTLTFFRSQLDPNQPPQPQYLPHLNATLDHAHRIVESAPSTWWWRFTSDEVRLFQPSLERFLAECTQLAPLLFTGEHRYAVMLQNSHELRATGGFMGSYVLLEWNENGFSPLRVKDIYQPTGQFQGFIEPPAGVKEYLSENRGWRLPDANWSPDFPTSSQHILHFMSLGNEPDLDGIIAINLGFVEDVLAITGDLSLSDYQTTVTADNIADVARADRADFFPGSYQKPYFLTSLATQLKMRLTQLSLQQYVALGKLLMQAIDRQDIQIYSIHPEQQDHWRQLGITGELDSISSPATPLSLLLIESNVGVNKANRYVSREVTTRLTDQTWLATITFTNQNLSDDYINYQRIYLDPQVKLTQVSINQQPSHPHTAATTSQPDIVRQLFTSTTQTQYQEYGFLVPVPAQSVVAVHFEIQLPQALSNYPAIIDVHHQSGLPPTPYWITYQGQPPRMVMIDHDQSVKLD